MSNRYAVIDSATGAWLAGPLDAAPEAGAGQDIRIVPIDYGAGMEWSPTRKAFVDIVSAAGTSSAKWITLFTPAEWKAIKTLRSTNIQVDYTWTWIEQADAVRLTDAIVQQGVAAAVTAGKLTPARAAQILAGNVPG